MSQAPNANSKNQQKSNVRQAHIPVLNFDDMSELGRDLFSLSREYETSGEHLLTEDEIENELTLRRGGHIQQNAA